MTNQTDVIAKLELASEIMMAAPNQVSHQARKDAEVFLMGLRDGMISIDECRYILENTTNSFLMFQIAQVLVSRLLKEFPNFSESEIEMICSYLLRESPALRISVPNFVRVEIFRSAAMIMKRSSTSMNILESDTLVKCIEEYVGSEDENYQVIGLQIIEALVVEFSTTWRSSNVSVTWDFHLNAKRRFEETLLKRFMKLSLRMLSQMITAELINPNQIHICEKFLRVASIVLSWNFASRFALFKTRILLNELKTTSFIPPPSWSEFFENSDIIDLFMELHTKVRYKSVELCQTSMICLVQLASVMATSDEFFTNSREKYVHAFMVDLIQVFSSEILETEMSYLSMAIYKLFTNNPTFSFLSKPSFSEELLVNFIEFVYQSIMKLTFPAMKFALVDNDHTYHEALHNFYLVWHTFYRIKEFRKSRKKLHAENSEVDVILSEKINNASPKVLEAFIKAVLHPPFGERQNNEITIELVQENEDEGDDRLTFDDLLCDIGHISIKCMDYFAEYVTGALNERLRQLINIANAGNAEHSLIQVWQEDMHWLLMLISQFLQHHTYDMVKNLPEEVVLFVLSGYKSGKFVAVNFEQLVASCLEQPFELIQFGPKIDPITSISLHVLSWFSIEHKMLLELDVNATLLSPELTRTSFWAFANLMNALSPISEHASFDNNLDEYTVEDLELLPKIHPNGPLYIRIFEMAMDKIVSILMKMSGEKRACEDAITLIITSAEKNAEVILKNEHFYNILAGLNIENLPSRRSLIKSLIFIGSSAPSIEMRQKMYTLLLEPLLRKFLELCNDPTSSDSQIADFYECFSGVADAGQSETATILFKFLQPPIQFCISLLNSRPQSQLLINAILEFVKTITDLLFFYVEGSEDCKAFHSNLLEIIDAYKKTQLQKYCSAEFISSDLEDQRAQDLITLIDILCESISKSYMPRLDGESSTEGPAKVALTGFEMILPLMNETLLKIPELCAAFFRLLLFISDFESEIIFRFSEQTLSNILCCISLALDNEFGLEKVKIALEIVNNIVTQFCFIKEAKPVPFENTLCQFLNKVFESSLTYSCEVEMFSEASNALYAIICLNLDNFAKYVSNLLELPSNGSKRQYLQSAFSELLDGTNFEVSKIAKRHFQEKFQQFLAKISGILCLR